MHTHLSCVVSVQFSHTMSNVYEQKSSFNLVVSLLFFLYWKFSDCVFGWVQLISHCRVCCCLPPEGLLINLWVIIKPVPGSVSQHLLSPLSLVEKVLPLCGPQFYHARGKNHTLHTQSETTLPVWGEWNGCKRQSHSSHHAFLLFCSAHQVLVRVRCETLSGGKWRSHQAHMKTKLLHDCSHTNTLIQTII